MKFIEVSPLRLASWFFLFAVELGAVSATAGIVRLGKHELWHRGQSAWEAQEICRTKGSRLPTALEMAEYGLSRGACCIYIPGVGNLGEKTCDRCPEDRFTGVRISSDGEHVDEQFSYNRAGYAPEEDDESHIPIWTQSHGSDRQATYVFDGLYGSLDAVSAMCVPGSFQCSGRERLVFTRCVESP